MSLKTIVGQYFIQKRRQRRRPPLVCICETQRVIGMVLRADYEKASQEYWRPYYEGVEHYDFGHIATPHGRLIKVNPVFIFDSYSEEYHTLTYHCYLERAMFEVPWWEISLEERQDELDAAYQYFFGRPFEGTLVVWTGHWKERPSKHTRSVK